MELGRTSLDVDFEEGRFIDMDWQSFGGLF
jgi:hypothetical protein